MTSLIIHIDFPANQPNGTIIDCAFNIGHDLFNMSAMLVQYYGKYGSMMIYPPPPTDTITTNVT